MGFSDAFLWGATGGGTWGKLLLVGFVAFIVVAWYLSALLSTVLVVAVIALVLAAILYYAGLRVDRYFRYGGGTTKKK